MNRSATLERLNQIRAWETIVFTNGVFDILHAGHIRLLEAAKQMGSHLVVGVNSDASVRMLNKGPNRPINCVEDRMLVLRSLKMVDDVLEFDESNPIELIKLVRPHVHVKGGDYRAEELPEAGVLRKMGAVIAIFPTVTGYSSTRAIEALEGNS